MKNIKEKGKNIKGKRKIFRQQMAAVCGCVLPLPLIEFTPKVVFLP